MTTAEGEESTEASADDFPDLWQGEDPNQAVSEPVEEVTIGSETAGSGTTYQRFDCTTDDPELLETAAEAARLAIENGECIVLPTDTVYGIGADAFNANAVQRLLDAKVRGRDMPPPVLIADSNLIRVLAVDVPQQAKDLVDRHWPGALTVICKAQPSLRLDLGEAEGTIALRVPDHELARDLLRKTGPMAVSSANISGLTAAVTIDEAIEQLGDGVSVYLDGGTLATAAEAAPSTMVDFTQSDAGQVLRHGALTVELLRETLPDLEDLVESSSDADDEPEDVGEPAQDAAHPVDESDPPDSDTSESDPPESDPPEGDPPESDPPETDPDGGEPDERSTADVTAETREAPSDDTNRHADPGI